MIKKKQTRRPPVKAKVSTRKKSPVKAKVSARKKSPVKAKVSPAHKRKNNIKEIMEWSGFTDRYIRKLIRSGMPHGKKKNPRGGKRITTFNKVEVGKWMTDQNIVLKTTTAKAVDTVARESGGNMNPDQDQHGQLTEFIDLEMFKLPGVLGALERARLKELRSSRLILAKQLYATTHLEDPVAGSQLKEMEKAASGIITSLRMLEKDALEYRVRTGHLIDYESSQREWIRVMLTFKNGVMGIPASLLSQLKNYLKDPDHISEVKEMIDDVCRSTLTNLPSEMPEA